MKTLLIVALTIVVGVETSLLVQSHQDRWITIKTAHLQPGDPCLLEYGHDTFAGCWVSDKSTNPPNDEIRQTGQLPLASHRYSKVHTSNQVAVWAMPRPFSD